MSKRRGLSAEEKATKMHELLVETKEVFTMKELEKIGPKQKGVISQSVQEVVKGLVDDGIATNDKVGTGMYYWCFPSDEVNRRNIKEAQLNKEIEALEARLAAADKAIEAATASRSAEDRAEVLAHLAELQQEEAQLNAELRSNSANDPEYYEALVEDAREALDAANRWTDNISTLRSYCVGLNSSLDESQLNKHFGIPEDLDYLDG